MTATEAPAMIAPEESATAPVISPKFCAASGITHSALKIDRARFEERDIGPSWLGTLSRAIGNVKDLWDLSKKHWAWWAADWQEQTDPGLSLLMHNDEQSQFSS